MLDHHWRVARTAHIRRRELLAEANQSRLAAQGAQPAARGRIVRIYGPALYRLGTWLTTWGTQLQAHYRASTARPQSERLALDHAEISGS